jgi:hypothetical protein
VVRLLLVTAAAAAFAGPAAAASPGYAFGHAGGNIRPFTVTVSPQGAVRATGPVTVGRTTLTAAQESSLRKTVAAGRLSGLPATTRCTTTLPDIATAWIRVGARTVRVHGACSARFTRVWNALAAAVRLAYS